MPGVSPEDIAEVIKAASNKSWEATMLAVIMIAAICCLAWFVRSWMNQATGREERMANRIDALETQLVTTLKEIAAGMQRAIEQNTAAFNKLNDLLADHPCLWSPERQKEFMRELKG